MYIHWQVWSSTTYLYHIQCWRQLFITWLAKNRLNSIYVFITLYVRFRGGSRHFSKWGVYFFKLKGVYRWKPNTPPPTPTLLDPQMFPLTRKRTTRNQAVNRTILFIDLHCDPWFDKENLRLQYQGACIHLHKNFVIRGVTSQSSSSRVSRCMHSPTCM